MASRGSPSPDLFDIAKAGSRFRTHRSSGGEIARNDISNADTPWHDHASGSRPAHDPPLYGRASRPAAQEGFPARPGECDASYRLTPLQLCQRVPRRPAISTQCDESSTYCDGSQSYCGGSDLRVRRLVSSADRHVEGNDENSAKRTVMRSCCCSLSSLAVCSACLSVVLPTVSIVDEGTAISHAAPAEGSGPRRSVTAWGSVPVGRGRPGGEA
jgi:hypothetical protein